MRWGIGQPPREIGTATVTVRAGESIEEAVERSTDHRQWTETIGGREARLATTHVAGGDYTVVAIWSTPSIYIMGTTRNEASAALQLRAIRTVEFTP